MGVGETARNTENERYTPKKRHNTKQSIQNNSKHNKKNSNNITGDTTQLHTHTITTKQQQITKNKLA